MELVPVLKMFFPSWLFDYFDAVRFEESEERMDVYLDEKKLIPVEQTM